VRASPLPFAGGPVVESRPMALIDGGVTEDLRGRPTWAMRCPVCGARCFWMSPWGRCVPCELRRRGHVAAEAGPWLGEPLGLDLRPAELVRYREVRAKRAWRAALLRRCRRVTFHLLPAL